MELDTVAILGGLIINIGLVIWGAGRLTQKVNHQQEDINELKEAIRINETRSRERNKQIHDIIRDLMESDRLETGAIRERLAALEVLVKNGGK